MDMPTTAAAKTSSLPATRWPAVSRPVLDWLVNETAGERFIDNIMVQMCERLIADGVPVSRASFHVRINHPEWLGARMLWTQGMAEAEVITFAYGIEDTAQFQNSPVRELREGAAEVRKRLDDVTEADYAIYQDLLAAGYTDYVAWPVHHTLGKSHVVTFCTSRPGGFSEDDIAYLLDLMPAFALVSASSICDLRDFTAISDAWPRDDVIGLLNGYFDAMCEPIEAYGGEILKFMGDGLLAVFPLSNPDACRNLMRAIAAAQVAIRTMNERNAAEGHQVLGYGIGVHVGDVMYGNIGSRTRLDFTVIGPAVNIASRIESLTKVVKRPVLMSRAFVDMAGCAKGMDNLGFHPVKGIGDPVEVLAFPDDASAHCDA